MFNVNACMQNTVTAKRFYSVALGIAYSLTLQVFFTNNGKTIGQREVRIPKGGFYPTVGMLSSDEKVLVDLRPLTG